MVKITAFSQRLKPWLGTPSQPAKLLRHPELFLRNSISLVWQLSTQVPMTQMRVKTKGHSSMTMTKQVLLSRFARRVEELLKGQKSYKMSKANSSMTLTGQLHARGKNLSNLQRCHLRTWFPKMTKTKTNFGQAPTYPSCKMMATGHPKSLSTVTRNKTSRLFKLKFWRGGLSKMQKTPISRKRTVNCWVSGQGSINVKFQIGSQMWGKGSGNP